MPRRVLICIEDTGVAHVVAARLMKDGIDGVVVGKPADLVAESEGGLHAVVVQDRYGTGEAGASILRQVRTARGSAAPAVYLISDEIAAADRLVLERQYLVREFLPVTASPHSIASALIGAAGPESETVDLDLDADIILHEDERRNDFDIEVSSRAQQMGDILGTLDFDDEEPRTVEVSLKELGHLRKESEIETELPTRRVHDEVTRGNPVMQAAETRLGDALDSFDTGRAPMATQEGGVIELSAFAEDTGDIEARSLVVDDIADLEAKETGLMEFTMPVPGASLDLQLPMDSGEREGINETSVDPLAVLTEAEDLDFAGMLGESDLADDDDDLSDLVSPPSTSPGVDDDGPVATDVAADGPSPTDDSLADDGPRAPDGPLATHENDEDEMEQIAELKKLLLAKKRQLDTAQKRIDELETKLTTSGGALTPTGDGLPNEGVFEELRYPMLLARARAEVFTGSIRMQLPGDTTRTIYVRNGLPVGFTTSEPGEKIGKVLVSQGRISDEQYVKAATRMVERGIKLSEALVDLGLIDAETLDVEIRNLTRDQIVAGFELVQGRYTVQTGDAPPASVPMFDFGPGEIYVQGYRQYAPRAEMHALFEQLRPKYLTANQRLPQLRPKLGLTGEDERLLRLLGEAYTVEEAVERAKVDPDEAAKLIAALQALDLVEEWNPGVEQFRTRLSSERQHFAEEIARLREENSRREKQLFEGFERALAKITVAMEAGAKPNVRLSDHVEEPKSPVSKPSVSSTTVSAPKSAPRMDPIKIETPPHEEVAKTESLRLEPVMATLSPPSPPPPSNGVSNGLPLAPGGVALADASVVNRPPTTPADGKFQEAVRQAADNRLDEAELTLREAVRMDAARPDFLTALARVLLANPRYERAGTLPVVKSLLDRAVQLSPDNTDARQLHKEISAELGA